jgi:hypothetical protein
MMKWWKTECIRFCWLRFKRNERKLISSWLALFLRAALNSSGAVPMFVFLLFAVSKFEGLRDWLLTWPLRGLLVWRYLRTIACQFFMIPFLNRKGPGRRKPTWMLMHWTSERSTRLIWTFHFSPPPNSRSRPRPVRLGVRERRVPKPRRIFICSRQDCFIYQPPQYIHRSLMFV